MEQEAEQVTVWPTTRTNAGPDYIPKKYKQAKRSTISVHVLVVVAIWIDQQSKVNQSMNGAYIGKCSRRSRHLEMIGWVIYQSRVNTVANVYAYLGKLAA